MIGHLKTIALGALGFVLMWGAWHLFIDHQNWHAVLNQMIAAQQQKAAQ